MSSTITPAAMGAVPIRWTDLQFHRMKSAGVFRGEHPYLIDGWLMKQRHEETKSSSPHSYRFSRDQYKQLGTHGVLTGLRTELIYGVIYQMSPIGWPHVVCVNKLTDLFKEVFAGIGWVNSQQPFTVDESDPQPDVAVIPGMMMNYTDHPTVSLLIVEVADTTLARDTTMKVELYASASVPEYWVVDLEGKQLQVFRDPFAIPAGGFSYRTHLTLKPAERIAPLAAPGQSVLVADLLP